MPFKVKSNHLTRLLPIALLLFSGCANADAPIADASRADARTGGAPTTLRILTLGDSITAIFRYQPFLREALRKEE